MSHACGAIMDGQVPGEQSHVESAAHSWRDLGFPSEEDMLDWLENQQRVGRSGSGRYRTPATVFRLGVLGAGVLMLWRFLLPRQ